MAIKQAVMKQLNMSEEELAHFLVEDMRQIFFKMVGLDNSLNSSMIIDPINAYNDSVTAMVGLGGTFSGLVSLHLPNAIALEFTSSMLHSTVTEIDEDVYDAMGELAVMIAGSLKVNLSNRGIDVFLSTPSVFTGREYSFSTKIQDESMAVLCNIREQWFMVNLTLVQQQ